MITNSADVECVKTFNADDVVQLSGVINEILSVHTSGERISVSATIKSQGKEYRFSSIEDFRSNFRPTSEIKSFFLFFKNSKFFECVYMGKLENQQAQLFITIECENEVLSERVISDITTNASFKALMSGEEIQLGKAGENEVSVNLTQDTKRFITKSSASSERQNWFRTHVAGSYAVIAAIAGGAVGFLLGKFF